MYVQHSVTHKANLEINQERKFCASDGQNRGKSRSFTPASILDNEHEVISGFYRYNTDAGAVLKKNGRIGHMSFRISNTYEG